MVRVANAGKSLAAMAASISCIRWGTIVFARWGNSELVATVACIPAVELTPFLAAETTRMAARMVGQCDAGAT